MRVLNVSWKFTWNNVLGYTEVSLIWSYAKTLTVGEKCFMAAFKSRSCLFIYLFLAMTIFRFLPLCEFPPGISDTIGKCSWNSCQSEYYFSLSFIKAVLSKLAVAVELSDQRWPRENHNYLEITVKSIVIYLLSYNLGKRFLHDLYCIWTTVWISKQLVIHLWLVNISICVCIWS